MITKIKWKDDAVLGNLELNFINPKSGKPYNTIVLAGENGSGKTTILAELSQFLNGGSIIPFDHIIYKTPNNEFIITPTENMTNNKSGFHMRKKVGTDQDLAPIKIIKDKINPNEQFNFQKDMDDLRYYGFAYTKARSGFRTSKVQSATASQLDIDKYTLDEQDDFTSIKQLLINICVQDNAAYVELAKKQKKDYSEFETQSKLYRFKQAFNAFFGTLKLDRVETEGDFNIVFTKNGKEINIDNLSTGEKQIVFRGAMLLKNCNVMENGVVLIDEPELSMHPRWQQKILQFYRNLFTRNNNQQSQLIVATHSEYVVKAALEDPENVLVIVLNDDNGLIKSKEIKTPLLLPTITAAEVNFEAFGIYSTDYHNQLFACLQDKTNTDSVSSCDKYIKNHKLFDNSKYGLHSTFTNSKGVTTDYYTLPSYIRNCISHPIGKTFTMDQLKSSTDFLIELCSSII